MYDCVEHLWYDKPEDESMWAKKNATGCDEYVEDPDATKPGEYAETIGGFAFDVFEVVDGWAVVFQWDHFAYLFFFRINLITEQS